MRTINLTESGRLPRNLYPGGLASVGDKLHLSLNKDAGVLDQYNYVETSRRSS
jgi:hypothetical protein